MEKVYEINSVRVTVLRTDSPSLSIAVVGNTRTPGFTDFALSHWIYINPPADGIYDVDMVATPPAGIALQVITPFEHTEVWEGYPVEHLKGMRIHSGTNNLEAMVD